MFTDRDLELWQKSLSGKGTTFEIQRSDLEGILERLVAAERVATKVFRLRQILYGLCLDLRQASLVQKYIDEVKEADSNWRKTTGNKY